MGEAPICEFQGAYRWLSNFWPAIVTLDGMQFPTVEHAYQAAKTLNRAQRIVLLHHTAGGAKRYARCFVLRSDWEEIKIETMRALVRQKFFDHLHLGIQLLATGDADLIEGNAWGDVFWGVCNGAGENHLGKILMAVRAELRAAVAFV